MNHRLLNTLKSGILNWKYALTPENIVDNTLENYVTLDSKFTLDMEAGILSEEKKTYKGRESFHTHFFTSYPISFIFIYILKNVIATTYVKPRFKP